MQQTHTTENLHIVFLGESTFPVGLGAIQRMTLVGKALISAGCKVTVVCRKGGLRKESNVKFDTQGIFEGMHYHYTVSSIYRPTSFLKRSVSKITGFIGEFRYLLHLKQKNALTAGFISNHKAAHIFKYRIFSRVIGFPIVLDYVEMVSSMKRRKGFWIKLNDTLLDRYVIKIVDGALPISDTLMDYYKRMSPSKPCLKLPILCDFEKFTPTEIKKESISFLYCGAATYFELIDFIINAFDKTLYLTRQSELRLILGGTDNELQRVRNRIDNAIGKEKITLLTNIPHTNIPNHYVNATALLIPLRPTLQDEARFPHKIGEYLASGRPVITTAYGEIRNYGFVDKKTALVANEYEVEAFSKKMEFVISNPEIADEIGLEGRKMGLENFDFSQHGKRLANYFSSLDQNI